VRLLVAAENDAKKTQKSKTAAFQQFFSVLNIIGIQIVLPYSESAERGESNGIFLYFYDRFRIDFFYPFPKKGPVFPPLTRGFGVKGKRNRKIAFFFNLS
jgi:hypothetical protein